MKQSLFVVALLWLCACVVPPSNPPPSGQSTPYPQSQYQSQTQAPQPAQTHAPQSVLAGTLDVKLLGCTKMACNAENPCCNNCSSEMSVIPESGPYMGRRIALEGHGCQTNQCSQSQNCNMSHGQRVELQDVNVDCTRQGGQCVGVFRSPMASDYVQAQPTQPPSQTTSLYGKIRANSQCTLMACPSNNQCCNSCNVSIMMVPANGPYAGQNVALEGHGCRADGCGRLSECTLQNDSMVTLPKVMMKCEGAGACVGHVVPVLPETYQNLPDTF